MTLRRQIRKKYLWKHENTGKYSVFMDMYDFLKTEYDYAAIELL